MTTVTERTWVVDNEPSTRFPVYTRGNVGEVFPDVVSPLGWSLVSRHSERGWRRAYRALGAFTEGDFDGELTILGVFNGYCYLNASLLRVFGVRSPGATPEAMDAQLLGSASAPPYDERKGDRNALRSGEMLRSVLRVLWQKELPTEAVRARQLAAEFLAGRPAADASDEELLAYVERFAEVYEEMFMLHLLTTSGSQIAGGFMAYCCLRAGDPGLQLDLTTDLGDVESAAPGEALWRLARMVRERPEVTAAFDEGLPGLLERLDASPAAAPFNEAFAAFLEEHGHRGPNEWEIASPTWRTKPLIALAAVDRMRLAGDERSPEHQRVKARAIREAAEAEILDNLGWRDRRNYRKARRATGLYAQAREATKNQTIRVVNGGREVLRELARRAAERGGIEDFSRVAMLTWDEFREYVQDPTRHHDEMERRFQLAQRLSRIEPPYVLVGAPPSLEELESTVGVEFGLAPAGTELQGSGGSPGVVQGRARIVHDASDPMGLEPGEILVAPITDPSWTPLFLAAGGVVVDVGAIQSHAVVVSRELCIPCVVSVKRATSIIPDGALVEINGSQGTVKILEHPI